jgi:hypothetical protein
MDLVKDPAGERSFGIFNKIHYGRACALLRLSFLDQTQSDD